MKFDLVVAIFPNLIANDYKSHLVVNGLVTFWLISTSELPPLFPFGFCVFACTLTTIMWNLEGVETLDMWGVFWAFPKDLEKLKPWPFKNLVDDNS